MHAREKSHKTTEDREMEQVSLRFEFTLSWKGLEGHGEGNCCGLTGKVGATGLAGSYGSGGAERGMEVRFEFSLSLFFAFCGKSPVRS